jgi:hypothetical protein
MAGDDIAATGMPHLITLLGCLFNFQRHADAQLPGDDGYYDPSQDPWERAFDYKFNQALRSCALPGERAWQGKSSSRCVLGKRIYRCMLGKRCMPSKLCCVYVLPNGLAAAGIV